MRNTDIINNLKKYLIELNKKKSEIGNTKKQKVAMSIEEVENEGLPMDLASNVDEYAELEERISSVKGKISLLSNLHPKKIKEKVESGDQLKLMNHTHEIDFVLTDKSELVDLERHIYSVYSPIGKSVMGKKFGDVIDLNNIQYQILP